MPDKYLCDVVYREKLSDEAFNMTVLSKRLALQAKAGQFVHIKCGHSRPLRRPVSISNVSGYAIDLVVQVKGAGTSWLKERKPGSKIDVIGPLGNGFTLPQGDIILVGGGIGVAPLLFAAYEAVGKVTAVLGFKAAKKIILKGAFEDACDEVIITTDDGSAGFHGSTVSAVEELLKQRGTSCNVLSCGPYSMLKALYYACKKYDAALQVSLEEKMGCGVGACLVCACETNVDGQARMSRACVEGPVFFAEDVVWG